MIALVSVSTELGGTVDSTQISLNVLGFDVFTETHNE